MALYKIKIQTERLVTGATGKEAALAVLKDLEIDLKFGKCLDIEIIEIKEALPSPSEIRGIDPDFTGELTTEEYIRRLRE